MASSASSLFNLDANSSQGEGQVPLPSQKSFYPSYPGSISQVMPTGMPFLTGYPNPSMAPSFFPMMPLPFPQGNPIVTTWNTSATAMPQPPRTSTTSMEGIIDSNPAPALHTGLPNLNSYPQVPITPEPSAEPNRHRSHVGDMVNDDITTALESFTLDSGPVYSTSTVSTNVVERSNEEELAQLRHENELLKMKVEAISALPTLTSSHEGTTNRARHPYTSRGMRSIRPYPEDPHVRGFHRYSPPRTVSRSYGGHYTSLPGYDPSCTVPITSIDAMSMIDASHNPNSWVIVDRILNIITATRRKQSINVVCERNGRQAPYSNITDGELTLLTQWNRRRPRWLGQRHDIKSRSEDGNNGRDLPPLPHAPVKVAAPEDTCLDPQLWAPFIFLHGTERQHPGVSITTTGSVNIRTLAGYLLFQSVVPNTATRAHRHGFAIVLASILVHPSLYSDICRDHHISIADSDELTPFPISLVSQASQVDVVTHLAKCGVNYSHVCYIQPYGRELLLSAVRRFKGPLRTHAFEALDDFAWRVNQFDVPHDVSSFQDDSAPRIYWSAPIEWDLKPILESRRRHFLNYPVIREAASKTSRGHQHSGKVTSRSDTSLLVTGDADVHMTGDGNASGAGPSISQPSTAPTTSPSTEASITMTPSAGSTPNVDGEVDELDPQDDIDIVF
ncbi:hypothetical protein IW262DRAFT_1493107 [Armillaria fumosa]|nr:hypothetical protein IW262DRAFT_1493107 [Armillaria fumosa]